MNSNNYNIQQTLSILSVFLLFTTSAIMIASSNLDDWIKDELSIRAPPLARFIETMLPPTRSEGKRDCDVLRQVVNYLKNDSRSKLTLNVNAGLKDACLHLKLKTRNEGFNMLQPNMYYCRDIDYLYNFADKKGKFNNEKKSTKMVYRMVDVVDESYHLMMASIAFSIAAMLIGILKSPMIPISVRWDYILQYVTLALLVGSVIASTWCLLLYYINFDPEGLLKTIRTEGEKKFDENGRVVLGKIHIQQSYGRPFHLTIAAVLIVVTVMAITIVEIVLMRKSAMQKKHEDGYDSDSETQSFLK